MTPELEALARRAVACPRWRWMPGMLSGGRRVVQAEAGAVCGTGVRMLPSGGWVSDPVYIDDLPDLTDPATLGCLLALVREAHGPSAVARLIGVNGRGGQEWAIFDRAPAVDGWHLAAPALGYWESEAEALVAALQNGGGGDMIPELEARRLSTAVDRLERESLEVLAALGLHEDTPHEKVLEHIRALVAAMQNGGGGA